ncbi:putative quinol monooxygenase [Mycobacterium sp. URHB0044]|uniref:putative quinol monooxygenase n=1 Tax=Mycobacterium sp. URHB0044 TaxID=1380386 RepID=UPI0004915C04|nr:putative quinol monooxygenase [Mycobacterium sp. URHB0044]
MYTLIVSLQVRPVERERFLAAIAANAAASVRDEPGCLRFDVMEDAHQPNRFYFYEIYRDAAAFDDHRAAPHFATWRQAADECVVPGSQVNSFSDLFVTHAAVVPA